MAVDGLKWNIQNNKLNNYPKSSRRSYGFNNSIILYFTIVGNELKVIKSGI